MPPASFPPDVGQPEPFNGVARRHQRRRVRSGHDFFDRALADDLRARIASTDRKFAVALDVGSVGISGEAMTIALDVTALPGVAVVADSGRLPLADASVDVIAALGLHTVNDLPGALILARRALRPEGLFVAALIGGTTLAEIRADLLAAEVELTGRAAARILPMVDPQAAPGLLQRAGFVDPVVEVDTVIIRYDDLAGVLRDLRGAGAGNILHEREPLRRDVLAAAAQRFAARAVAGRIAVTVQVITLTGWGR